MAADETLLEITVVNGIGVLILETKWRQAGCRRERVETERVPGATALMRRLEALVRVIAGSTPEPVAAAT